MNTSRECENCRHCSERFYVIDMGFWRNKSVQQKQLVCMLFGATGTEVHQTREGVSEAKRDQDGCSVVLPAIPGPCGIEGKYFKPKLKTRRDLK